MAYGDLCALGDVKAWLQTGQNAFPATDDTLLSGLITAASRFIERWLGRPVLAADWQEVRDGTGGERLAFAIVPVTAVLSLTIDGIAIPAAPNDGGYGPGYVFTPTELALRGYRLTRRVQNVVVAYTAGYAAPPPDIAQACIELVAQRYRERSRAGAVSKSLGGGESASFSQKDMSDDIRTLLQQHRAVAPVSGFLRAMAMSATDPAIVAGAL